MDVLLVVVWSQLAAPDPDATPLLSLRRWYESLTLGSPFASPSSVPAIAWLCGLLGLFLIALALQGPRKGFAQFFDISGHFRTLGAAIWRLRNAGRAVAILLGMTVLNWTVSQFVRYAGPIGLNDLYVFTRTKTLSEIGVEQGFLAALTPMRDICGLGDVLLLSIGVTVLVFRLSANRWGDDDPYRALEAPLPRWTTLCWGATWLYAMYRFAMLVVETGGLPLGGCLLIEAAIIPLLMAMSDGILLACLLAELRSAGLADDVGRQFDIQGAILLWPASILACLLALPSRYVATATWLLWSDLPSVTAIRQFVAPLLNGWGLVILQGAALVTTGLIGATAWSSGHIRDAIRGYIHLLRVQGGRLVATLLCGGIAAGGFSALAYWLVLSLPRQPWVLAAADSYAHYATLVVGLTITAVLVELGSLGLPSAALAVGMDEDSEDPPQTPISGGAETRPQAIH